MIKIKQESQLKMSKLGKYKLGIDEFKVFIQKALGRDAKKLLRLFSGVVMETFTREYTCQVCDERNSHIQYSAAQNMMANEETKHGMEKQQENAEYRNWIALRIS